MTDLADKQRFPAERDYACMFSLVVPTYNRAHLLPRALASIDQQTCRDFEVIVIDDGSTDATREVVDAWAQGKDFPVRYVYQHNQGHKAALNTSLEYLQGYFLFFLDSDDALAPNALERCLHYWRRIPVEQVADFAGVEGLDAILATGEIAGSRYPYDEFDANYMEVQYRYHVSGDKKFVWRSDIARAYPWPLHPGEKHIRTSLIFCRMAKKYKTRYFNEILQYIEYQPDGLSSNASRRRASSPNNYYLSFLEMVNDFPELLSRRQQRSYLAKAVRYGFLAGKSPGQMWRDVHDKGLFLQVLLRGYGDSLRDRARLKKTARRAA